MKKRKLAVLVSVGVLIALAAKTGAREKIAARPAACQPVVSGAPATVFDGNLSTFWQTPGQIQQQQITIDLQCVAKLRRFRRSMTCDGTATSGSPCNFRSQDGKRHKGFDQVSFTPAVGVPETKALDVASGWEAYEFAAPPFGPYFDALPYGWTPWLDFRSAANPDGVFARFVRFTFVDLADAVNEIEIEYAEQPAGPGADLSLTFKADPSLINSPAEQGLTSFRAVVANLGPSPATGVKLTSEVTETGEPSQGACDQMGGCDLGDLPVGTAATVDFPIYGIFGNMRQAWVRSRQPDSISRNNSATATITYVDCEQLPQACPLLWLLAKWICELQAGARPLLREAARALPADPDVFYRLREEVLRRTPEGRRYIGLYERYGGEISRIFLLNPTVLDRAMGVLPLWEPLFRDLVESGGSRATLTAQHVSALTDLLEDLKRLGSAELRDAIAREQSALDLSSHVGQTMDVALGRFQRGACPGGDGTLCLQSGRFQASVSWRDSQGRTGTGHATPLTSDTGSFWFFSPDNVELVVKALDGRAIDGKWWVFYGSLSNVEYTLTVTDTATGAVRTYTNPQGTFASVGDTAAFAPGPAPGAASSDAPPAGSASELLTAGRFKVESSWRDSQGHSGAGHAVRLTSDTAYFWFFNPQNIELVVKTLDARAVNGKWWVFSGALTNVEYTVTVTDTVTGAVRTYGNPSGRFASFGDTAAFQEP